MATRARKTMMSNPLDDIGPAKEEPVVKKTARKRTPEVKQKISEKSPSLKKERKAPTQKSKAVHSTRVEREIDAETVMNEAIGDSAAALKNISLPGDNPENQPQEVEYVTAEAIFEKELTIEQSQPVCVRSVFNDAAIKCVKRWSQWSVVASLVPLPLVGVLAMSSAQVKMIHDLCKLYNVDFEHKIALAVATGLASGTLTKTVASNATLAVARNLPGVGAIMTVVFEPALAYGTTYAIGTAFVSHFEKSGTLHNFDPETMKDYFAEQLNKGKAFFKQKKTAAI